MKVSEIVIKGLFSFKDETKIPLVNGKAFCVGPNGTGKTNLIRAVELLLDFECIETESNIQYKKFHASLRSDEDAFFCLKFELGDKDISLIRLLFDCYSQFELANISDKFRNLYLGFRIIRGTHSLIPTQFVALDNLVFGSGSGSQPLLASGDTLEFLKFTNFDEKLMSLRLTSDKPAPCNRKLADQFVRETEISPLNGIASALGELAKLSIYILPQQRGGYKEHRCYHQSQRNVVFLADLKERLNLLKNGFPDQQKQFKELQTNFAYFFPEYEINLILQKRYLSDLERKLPNYPYLKKELSEDSLEEKFKFKSKLTLEYASLKSKTGKHFGLRDSLKMFFRNKESDVLFPARNASGGMIEVLSLLLAFASQDGTIFLDEPGNNLHPHTKKLLGDFILSQKNSIFLVTHAAEFITYRSLQHVIKFNGPPTQIKVSLSPKVSEFVVQPQRASGFFSPNILFVENQTYVKFVTALKFSHKTSPTLFGQGRMKHDWEVLSIDGVENIQKAIEFGEWLQVPYRFLLDSTAIWKNLSQPKNNSNWNLPIDYPFPSEDFSEEKRKEILKKHKIFLYPFISTIHGIIRPEELSFERAIEDMSFEELETEIFLALSPSERNFEKNTGTRATTAIMNQLPQLRQFLSRVEALPWNEILTSFKSNPALVSQVKQNLILLPQEPDKLNKLESALSSKWKEAFQCYKSGLSGKISEPSTVNFPSVDFSFLEYYRKENEESALQKPLELLLKNGAILPEATIFDLLSINLDKSPKQFITGLADVLFELFGEKQVQNENMLQQIQKKKESAKPFLLDVLGSQNIQITKMPRWDSFESAIAKALGKPLPEIKDVLRGKADALQAACDSFSLHITTLNIFDPKPTIYKPTQKPHTAECFLIQNEDQFDLLQGTELSKLLSQHQDLSKEETESDSESPASESSQSKRVDKIQIPPQSHVYLSKKETESDSESPASESSQSKRVDKIRIPPQFHWQEIREDRNLPMLTRRELENVEKPEASELLPSNDEDIQLLEQLFPDHEFTNVDRIRNDDAQCNYEIFKQSLQAQSYPHERQTVNLGNPNLLINQRINEVYLWISLQGESCLEEIAERTGITPSHKNESNELGKAYYFLVRPPDEESDNILCKVILGTPCFDPHLCKTEEGPPKFPFASKFFQHNKFLLDSAITTCSNHYITVNFADQILPIFVATTKLKCVSVQEEIE